MTFCLKVKTICMFSYSIYKTEICKQKEVIIRALTTPFRLSFSVNVGITLRRS